MSVQFFQSGGGIADDLEIRPHHFVHFGRIDIDVDDFGIGTEFICLSNDSVIESRAYINQQVAFNHRFVGVGCSMHPQHAQRQFMCFRENAFAQQGRSNRGLECGRQLHQLFVGAGDHAAMAGKNYRPLRLSDHAGCFINVSFGKEVAFVRLIAGQFHRGVHVAGEVALRNVFGNIDQNWPRTTGCRNVKGFACDAWQVV